MLEEKCGELQEENQRLRNVHSNKIKNSEKERHSINKELESIKEENYSLKNIQKDAFQKKIKNLQIENQTLRNVYFFYFS